MLLINKNHLFNEDDIKNYEMVEYENYKEDIILLEKNTFDHFMMLKYHLKVDDINIDIKDGYRSLEKQENIFLDVMKKYGIDEASNIEDMPGTSDYHSATAIGFTIKVKDNWIDDYKLLFKYKKILKKIHNNLKYFGFVLRYPIGKEEITFHEYEPWHITYIGDLANEFEGTIEEYEEKRWL